MLITVACRRGPLALSTRFWLIAEGHLSIGFFLELTAVGSLSRLPSWRTLRRSAIRRATAQKKHRIFVMQSCSHANSSKVCCKRARPHRQWERVLPLLSQIYPESRGVLACLTSSASTRPQPIRTTGISDSCSVCGAAFASGFMVASRFKSPRRAPTYLLERNGQ